MIIGVISDSHDHLDNLKRAVDTLRKKGIQLIIHCGDIISPFCLDILGKSGVEWTGVLGNNDGEVELLVKRSEGRLSKEPKELELDGKRILVKHFHHFVEEIARANSYHLILYGHTHKPQVETIGKTLVVNPGECCGWLTGRPTAAIVDLSSMEAEILEL